jgi:hypothetical protein
VAKDLIVQDGAWYLILLGALAIAVMLFAPKGLWGYASDRFGLILFIPDKTPPCSEGLKLTLRRPPGGVLDGRLAVRRSDQLSDRVAAI